MRELIRNDFESAFAASQRKAAAYLMLCDGMAYIAGGEPFYFIDEWGRHSIGPVGPDRAADPHEEWAQSAVLETIGRYRSLTGSQAAIFYGNFFAFDTPLNTVRKMLPQRNRRRNLPVIEILIPATVKVPLARFTSIPCTEGSCMRQNMQATGYSHLSKQSPTQCQPIFAIAYCLRRGALGKHPTCPAAGLPSLKRP
jgi:hypothetical protein